MLLCRIVGYRPFFYATFRDEQRDGRGRGSSPWAADPPGSLGASHGALRPLYLRLQHQQDSAGERGGGVTTLQPPPSKAQSEKMNQSWPPPSPAMSPRVLTPSQHRGRRILQPISSSQTSLHDSGGSTDEPFPRRPTPVQARAGTDTPSRHRIPPLPAAAPAEPRPAFQEPAPEDGGEELAARRAVAKARGDKSRPRRRHRVRASSREQQQLQQRRT